MIWTASVDDAPEARSSFAPQLRSMYDDSWLAGPRGVQLVGPAGREGRQSRQKFVVDQGLVLGTRLPVQGRWCRRGDQELFVRQRGLQVGELHRSHRLRKVAINHTIVYAKLVQLKSGACSGIRGREIHPQSVETPQPLEGHIAIAELLEHFLHLPLAVFIREDIIMNISDY